MTKDTKEETRATYTVKNKAGYSLLITIPASATEEEISDLFRRLDFTDQLLGVNEFTPAESKPSYTKAAPKEKNWTGKLCPVDGGRLYSDTTKTGKPFIACENRKFDFITKTPTGCSYILWEKTY